MIRRPPRSTPFPTRRSSDLMDEIARSLAAVGLPPAFHEAAREIDRKSTRLNSSHSQISYAVFCLKKKKLEMSSNMHGPCHPTPPSRRTVTTIDLSLQMSETS